MSDRYLVALAFHSDNPGDLSPSAASIAQFESALSVRYDGAIRKALPGRLLDPAELRYISVLAVLSAGQTVAAQVKDACRFFLALEPEVPPSGSSAFVARETLAMAAGDGAPVARAAVLRASVLRTAVRTASPGRKKAVRTSGAATKTTRGEGRGNSRGNSRGKKRGKGRGTGESR